MIQSLMKKRKDYCIQIGRHTQYITSEHITNPAHENCIAVAKLEAKVELLDDLIHEYIDNNRKS